jgi:hypothetical protein
MLLAASDLGWWALLVGAPLLAVAIPLVLVRRRWRFVPAYGLAVPALLIVADAFVSNTGLTEGNEVNPQLLVRLAAILALPAALAGMAGSALARRPRTLSR